MGGPEYLEQGICFSVISQKGRRDRKVDLSQPLKRVIPPRQKRIVHFLTFTAYRGAIGEIESLLYLQISFTFGDEKMHCGVCVGNQPTVGI